MNQALAVQEETLMVPPVDTGDRLSFTFFVAIALHAFLLLGFNFKLPDHSNTSQPIFSLSIIKRPAVPLRRLNS
jgi:periplasmic protein TonB